MLEREARVTGSLEHPNIVPVYDVGRAEDGNPYYVMRLVAEPTLGQVLGHLVARDVETIATYTPGRLPPPFHPDLRDRRLWPTAGASCTAT